MATFLHQIACLAILATIAHSAAIHTEDSTQPSESWKNRHLARLSRSAAELGRKIRMAPTEHDDGLMRRLDGRRGRRNGFCDAAYSSTIKCEYATCDACVTASSSYYWIGYCTTTAQNADSGFMGAYWGGGTNDCATAKTVRNYDITCMATSGSETDDCTATTISSQSSGYFKGIHTQRTDLTIASSLSLIDVNANSATYGQMTSTSNFLNAISWVMISNELHGGYDSLNQGPPSMYQSTSYITIPAGGMTDTSLRMTGTNTYMVYDAAYTYDSSTYAAGVGDTTSYSGVTFTQMKGFVDTSAGLAVSGSGLSKTITMYVCSSSSDPQICLKSKISASGFTQDGLAVSNSASKVDVFLNKPSSYSGSQNSAGIRMLGVSTSYSGTVQLDDTGNSANEESDTFGAAYFITENTVQVSSSAINPSTNWASFPTANVIKKKQSLTSTDGSECGYTASDWYSTSGSGYSNAKEFFANNGFAQMECMMFSFASSSTSNRNMVWDPILGIDESAAASSSGTSGSDGLATWAIAVICVAGVVVVAGAIAGTVFMIKRKQSIEPTPLATQDSVKVVPQVGATPTVTKKDQP